VYFSLDVSGNLLSCLHEVGRGLILTCACLVVGACLSVCLSVCDVVSRPKPLRTFSRHSIGGRGVATAGC
jgi:hypothetical protein